MSSYQQRQDAENFRTIVIMLIFVILLIIGAIIYFSEALFRLASPITLIVFIIWIFLIILKFQNYEVDNILILISIFLVICVLTTIISYLIAFEFGATHFGTIAKQTFDSTFDHNKGLIGALT